jgi:ferredoxin
MQVSVNQARCQGHTLCNLAAPTVFLLREEDGHAYVDQAAVAPPLASAIRDAEATCPERAVEVRED